MSTGATYTLLWTYVLHQVKPAIRVSTAPSGPTQNDRIYQLYVMFRRMDHTCERIDLLLSHEGLSSWHMEDYR